jgi:hypothetical protein
MVSFLKILHRNRNEAVQYCSVAPGGRGIFDRQFGQR